MSRPALGICRTKQLCVKSIDEHWAKADADAKQAQKSSHTNYTYKYNQICSLDATMGIGDATFSDATFKVSWKHIFAILECYKSKI